MDQPPVNCTRALDHDLPREIAKKGSEAEVLQVSYHIEGMSNLSLLLKILYLRNLAYGKISNKFLRCHYQTLTPRRRNASRSGLDVRPTQPRRASACSAVSPSSAGSAVRPEQ